MTDSNEQNPNEKTNTFIVEASLADTLLSLDTDATILYMVLYQESKRKHGKHTFQLDALKALYANFSLSQEDLTRAIEKAVSIGIVQLTPNGSIRKLSIRRTKELFGLDSSTEHFATTQLTLSQLRRKNSPN